MLEWINNDNLTLYLQVGILALLVILVVVQQRRIAVTKENLERYQRLLKDCDGTNLEAIIFRLRSELNVKGQDLEKLAERIKKIEDQLPELVQHIGIIRFKGFEDVGGDLSFSTAILNGQGDGIVITALHARDDTRIYAKKVEKYVSAYPLSEEEIAAIKQSQKR